jgi:coatomer protein complex subunit gamma
MDFELNGNLAHFFLSFFFLLEKFNCTNTLQEQVLENVYVKVDTSGVKGVKMESVVPLPSLPYGTPGATYICVHRTNPEDYCTGSFSNTLKFKVKEVDPSTGEPEETGVDDEYQVEDLELSIGDYVQRLAVPNFNEKWEQLGDDFEVVQTFALTSIKSLQG